MNRHWLALALTLALGAGAQANEKRSLGFGTLEPMDSAAARAKVTAWLKEAGKLDAQTSSLLEAIWKGSQSAVDSVAASAALGDAKVAKLMADARNAAAPAPVQVDEFFKDEQVSKFIRANVALAYARALTNRRVYEESLEVLKQFSAEQVADPAAYLFFRAVCEHALLQKPEATKTITRLHEEAGPVSPDRYKTVATLMLLDMHTWKDKDLGSIARKMDNIERRLELARGGPVTQKMQKEVVARLDELIKKMENQNKNQQQAKSDGKPGEGKPGDPNGGSCPGGGPPQPGSGPPQGNNPSSPATESGITTAGGTGAVDVAKMQRLVQDWGRLPAREQARALQELTQGMSPHHREAVENYFRNLAQARRP